MYPGRWQAGEAADKAERQVEALQAEVLARDRQLVEVTFCLFLCNLG
jgi:hypothetical protein